MRRRIYQNWINMRHRVRTNPTYADCSICPEWEIFDNFYHWVVRQDWQGKQLDKDIIQPGNRLYAPELCCFVTREVNLLIKVPYTKPTGLPAGVTKYRGRYVAQMRTSPHRSAHLGVFDTIDQAHAAYTAARVNRIREVAKTEADPRIQDGLLMHAALLEVPE